MPIDIKNFEQMVDDILDRIVQANVGLTDIGETSKLRIIIEAIVSEMDIQGYILSYIYNAFNTDNLSGEHLEKRVADIGIYRNAGTHSIGNVIFYRTTPTTSVTLIPKGTRISTQPDDNGNIVTFVVHDNHTIPAGELSISVSVICDSVGYNYLPTGSVNVMIDPIIGISYVSNLEPINSGSDMENDGSLRDRYYSRLRLPATSGNIHHYAQWAREVDGVGGARVIPLWNGRGTVKVVVTGSNGHIADPSIIKSVEDHIEVTRPIGATVTVVSAEELEISISSDVKLKDGYMIQQVQSEFEEGLEEYRRRISFKTDYVSYAAISNILFDTEGVEDYSGLLLNGTAGNVMMGDEEIPVFSSISLAVM